MTTTGPRRFRVQPVTGRRGRRRRVLQGLGMVLAVLLVLPAVSVGRALAAPGTDTTSARLAEWARDHGFDGVITWLEAKTYHAPKVGGLPLATSPLRAAPRGPVSALAETALPPPIAPIAAPALPGEGSWRVLASVHGAPALAAAYLRPDAMHTSYVSAVVWIDPRLVRAQLHPGSLDPGGSGWAQPSDCRPTAGPGSWRRSTPASGCTPRTAASTRGGATGHRCGPGSPRWCSAATAR